MEKIHYLEFTMPLLIGLFWAIVFIQSGLDKVFDWKGNLAWINSHFEKTVFKNFTKFSLLILTSFELLAGFVSLFGIISFLSSGNKFWIIQGVILSAISLLMLLFGQRVAKDYEGAKTIVIYFGVVLVCGLILL